MALGPECATTRSSITCTRCCRRPAARAGPPSSSCSRRADGEDDDWIPIDESIAAWRRAGGDEVEIVCVPGTGHDPVLVSGEVSPRYTETLVTWLRARS